MWEWIIIKENIDFYIYVAIFILTGTYLIPIIFFELFCYVPDIGKVGWFYAPFVVTMFCLFMLIGYEVIDPTFEIPEMQPLISRLTKNKTIIFILYIVIFILLNKFIGYMINDYYPKVIPNYIKEKYQDIVYTIMKVYFRFVPNAYIIPHILLFYVKCD